MFKPGDFVDYFSEIEMLEKNMRDLYAEAAGMVHDPEIKKTLKALESSEQKHADLVDEVRKIAVRKTMGSE